MYTSLTDKYIKWYAIYKHIVYNIQNNKWRNLYKYYA